MKYCFNVSILNEDTRVHNFTASMLSWNIYEVHICSQKQTPCYPLLRLKKLTSLRCTLQTESM